MSRPGLVVGWTKAPSWGLATADLGGMLELPALKALSRRSAVMPLLACFAVCAVTDFAEADAPCHINFRNTSDAS